MSAPTVALTDRQIRIVEFIRAYKAVHHYPPSVRDVGKAVRLVSPSSAAYQLRLLADLGLVSWDPKIPRSIVLVEELPAGEVCWRCHGSGRTS